MTTVGLLLLGLRFSNVPGITQACFEQHLLCQQVGAGPEILHR